MESITIKFPDKIFLENNRINLSGFNDENIISINGLDYLVSQLIDDNGKQLKGGGNSFILLLNAPNPDEINDDDPISSEAIIKICKYPVSSTSTSDKQRIERFKYEIRALVDLQSSNNVITIQSYGKVKLKKKINTKNGQTVFSEEMLFYAMDYAQYTLPKFLKNNPQLPIYDKLELCFGISKGLFSLREKGYYHRDIKADNILFFEGEWKISDLGLANNQNKDTLLDYKNEKIGPYGWLSPEVMNKVLTEGDENIAPPFDNLIDYHSDIFQLGKLFWYIFQGNLPIGVINKSDFRIDDDELYNLIFKLLQHKKSDRIQKIEDVLKILITIQKKYILT